MIFKIVGGKEVQVDEEDIDLISKYRWYATKRRHKLYEIWYAQSKDNKKTIYMHRLLMGEPGGKSVDHINQDGLDNRRENLRIANNSEQERNTRAKKKRAAKHSQYKGVSWHVLKKPSGWIGGRWRAEIELPGRKRKIKYANSEIEAAQKYNELALEYFGEHARLNVI